MDYQVTLEHGPPQTLNEDVAIRWLMERHNEIVKPKYQTEDENGFHAWLDQRSNHRHYPADCEAFVEIPALETKSGAPVILEFNDASLEKAKDRGNTVGM